MNKTISILIMSLCCVMATENTFASPAQKKSVKELIKLSNLENRWCFKKYADIK